MKAQLTPSKLGYGGTKQEMQRLLEDAQKLSGVEYNIDNLGDVYDAIHVIQQDLGLTGVAAAEASETFSGSFNAMKAAAQNFLGSLALGENVNAALNDLLTKASTFFFGNFIPMLGTILRALPGAVWTFISAGVPMLLSNVSTMISTFALQISALARSLTAEKVTAWISNTLPKVVKAGASIIRQFAATLLRNMPQIVAAIGRIGSAIVRGLGAAIWGKVSAAANGIKERFLAPINSMKDSVSGIIETIKGWFPISIGNLLSNIKLPHFSISWSSKDFGPLGTIKYPTGINFAGWWAKGGIFTQPTLAGIGESGPEAVVPLDKLWSKMDKMAETMQGGGVTINVYASPGMDVKALAREVRNELISTENRRRLAWQ